MTSYRHPEHPEEVGIDDKCRAAIEYVERGWLVLPVIGKRPHPKLARRGLHSATSDPDIVCAWWKADPYANVAIACRPSGLLVIDVDPRHGGDDVFSELEQELGAIPDTPRTLTGGGGFHVFLRNPGGWTVAKLGPGVDVRDKAYVVAPPSRHASGRRYEWEITPDEVEIAALPDLWREALTQKPRDRSHRRTGRIPEGCRHATLLANAGAMRRVGMNGEAIRVALLSDNESRCDPPLEPEDVERIARWIGRKAEAPLWALDALAFANVHGEALSPPETLVLVALAHRANEKGQVIGGKWITRETRLGVSTVQRAIKSLVKLGRVTQLRGRSFKDGIWQPSIYQLDDA